MKQDEVGALISANHVGPGRQWGS